MLAPLANLGLVAFLLTSLVVGTRLLWMWRRTRALPELLVGAGFVVGGVLGFVPEHLALSGALPNAAERPVLIVANLAVRLTAILCAVFTWQVFRAGRRSAQMAVAALTLGLLVSYLGFPGPWARAESQPDWAWSAATAVIRSLAFAWAAWVALVEWRAARRRVALGLVEPDVARRFGLWGLAMTGPAMMSAVPLLTRWLLLPDPGPELAWMGVQSAFGLLAAGAMARAFLRRDATESAQALAS